MVEQRVVPARGHDGEGLVPAGAWRRGGTDHETVVLDLDLDRLFQLALRQQRLGQAEAAGIADANQVRFHDVST